MGYDAGVEPALQIVTQLPLIGLWDETGDLVAVRGGDVSEAQIIELMREQDVQFVVADLGYSLRWVRSADTARFWKQELKGHVAPPGSQVSLDDYPGGFAFWASQWSTLAFPCVVVLEKIH